MTGQTDAAEAETLAEVLCREYHRETIGYVSSLQPAAAVGEPTWKRVPCRAHRVDAERILASDWLAAREAAAEARGAERALREAAEEISGSDVIPLGRTQTREWLRARAAAAGGAR